MREKGKKKRNQERGSWETKEEREYKNGKDLGVGWFAQPLLHPIKY